MHASDAPSRQTALCIPLSNCTSTEQGPKLEHVAILHHNPQGHVVFMHRTSGGKVNPIATPGALFEPHYITLPLHPQAAWDMFEGAAEDQNYRSVRHCQSPALPIVMPDYP